jgi:hypothetical protein
MNRRMAASTDDIFMFDRNVSPKAARNCQKSSQRKDLDKKR